MSYTYVWPSTLPQSPQKGFGETYGLNITRTPMDAGPAKQRFRGRKPNNLSLTFLMTSAQVQTLESFVYNTLHGVARFGFRHPRTEQIAECRIVPQSAGDLYTLQYAAPGYYNVVTTFEVLP